MDRNKRLAELLGICWHEVDVKRYHESLPADYIYYCETCQTHFPKRELRKHRNPDYAADPRLILGEMVKREDFETFLCSIRGETSWNSDEKVIHYFVDVDYILDTTGKLRDAVIEFLEMEV